MRPSERVKRREQRRKYLVERAKRVRNERRKKHLCIDCGKEVEPIIVYHQRCEKHHLREKLRVKKEIKK